MFVDDLIEGGLVLLQVFFLALGRGHFPAANEKEIRRCRPTTSTKSILGFHVDPIVDLLLQFLLFAVHFCNQILHVEGHLFLHLLVFLNATRPAAIQRL